MKRALYGLLAAQAISLTGSRMSMLALPWFVLVTTHSVGMTGVVAFAEMTPYVLASAVGGPLLDRFGVRRGSILCDIGSFAAFAAIPLLNNTAALIAVVAVGGGLRGFGDLSKRVLFPRAVEAAGMDTTRGAGLIDGIQRLATLLGAPLAGVLIAATDARTVILIDAASFLAGAALVAGLVRLQPKTQPHQPYLAALKSGVVFLRSERLLAALLLLFFTTNLLDAAYISVLLPAWANAIGAPVALGMIGGSFALGAVLGNIAFTALAPRLPRYSVFVIGFLIGGAPRYLVPALSEELWLIYAVSFVAGLGIASINPISGALLFERVPEHMMARVQGIATALGYAGIPLGALLGGLAAEGIGIAPTLILFGLIYLAANLQPLLWPAWRQLSAKQLPAKQLPGEQLPGEQIGQAQAGIPAQPTGRDEAAPVTTHR